MFEIVGADELDAIAAGPRRPLRSAAAMFAAEMSTPVTVAAGSASASLNASMPVPQPMSSTRSGCPRGTRSRTMSRMRADRSAGALQVFPFKRAGHGRSAAPRRAAS